MTERREVYQVASEAWTAISKQRGYSVSRDAAVCIFVATLISERLPGSQVVKIPVPEFEDFEAVVVGIVDGKPSVIDAAHLTWSTKKRFEEPDLEQATLVLPIQSDINVRHVIPHWKELEPAYLDALEGFIHQTAGQIGL